MTLVKLELRLHNFTASLVKTQLISNYQIVTDYFENFFIQFYHAVRLAKKDQKICWSIFYR